MMPGVPNLLGDGAIVGVAVAVGVGSGGGVAVAVAVGVGTGGAVAVAVGVGVGNVTAAVLRSMTSLDCGSVNITSVPRPKITRFVSINSPAAFCSNCVRPTSAMSGSLGK